MKKFNKIDIKALHGYIWVEDYGDTKEIDKAMIYDENMAYLDYISLDDLSKEEYDAMLQEFEQPTSIDDFLDGFCTSYDYSESLPYLLESIFDTGDCTDETWQELQHDIATLSENELVDKYCINRVGDYYFWLGV